MSVKKIIALSVVFLILTGCSFNKDPERLRESIQNTIEEEYYLSTHKGKLIIELPESLIANSTEAKLLESMNELNYHIQTTSTAKIDDSTIKINAEEETFFLRMFKDDKQSLLGNGTGWYLFDNMSISHYLNPTLLEGMMSQLIPPSEAKLIQKEKNTLIDIDGVKVTTTAYSFDVKSQQEISIGKKDFSLQTDSGRIVFYVNDQKQLVALKYDIEFLSPNLFNKDVSRFKLSGTALYQEIGNKELSIDQPQISERYESESDFWIDLILKSR